MKIPHYQLGGLAYRANLERKTPSRKCVMCLLRLGVGFKMAAQMVPTVSKLAAMVLRKRLMKDGALYFTTPRRNRPFKVGSLSRAKGSKHWSIEKLQAWAWSLECDAFRVGDEQTHWSNHKQYNSHMCAKNWHIRKLDPKYKEWKYEQIRAYHRSKGKHWHREKLKRWKSSGSKRAIAYKIANSLRYRIYSAIRHGKHGDRFIKEMCGCSTEQLVKHIESGFKNGMTWKNWGKYWHIDHIVPCCAFDLSDDRQAKLCSHWSNLRPLKAIENARKSGRLTHPQLPLLLAA